MTEVKEEHRDEAMEGIIKQYWCNGIKMDKYQVYFANRTEDMKDIRPQAFLTYVALLHATKSEKRGDIEIADFGEFAKNINKTAEELELDLHYLTSLIIEYKIKGKGGNTLGTCRIISFASHGFVHEKGKTKIDSALVHIIPDPLHLMSRAKEYPKGLS